MSKLSLPDVLRQAGDPWVLVSFNQTQSELFSRAEDALAAFYDGFKPEWTLATMQSEVKALKGAEDLPERGKPLHLEAYNGPETRILRYLSGAGWRVTVTIEEEGGEYAAEEITFLGTGEASEGPIKRLIYKKYWDLDKHGSWHAVGTRLSGVVS